MLSAMEGDGSYQMPTVDCETSEEYFYYSELFLASEASEHSFHSANEDFFLPYDVKLISSLTNCSKLFFSPYWREFKICAK